MVAVTSSPCRVCHVVQMAESTAELTKTNSDSIRSTVQSFIGAMTGGGCRKGVFVTSSTFTAEAKSYANDLRDMKLVLIDGKKLAELMIQHEVGVQVKSTYQISKVDHDFFESF
jgi:restriction endonuclease Mrr